jgi:hypothetical protein
VHHAQYQEPSDITEEETYEEGCQPLEEEQELSHDSPKEDLLNNMMMKYCERFYL